MLPPRSLLVATIVLQRRPPPLPSAGRVEGRSAFLKGQSGPVREAACKRRRPGRARFPAVRVDFQNRIHPDRAGSGVIPPVAPTRPPRPESFTTLATR